MTLLVMGVVVMVVEVFLWVGRTAGIGEILSNDRDHRLCVMY